MLQFSCSVVQLCVSLGLTEGCLVVTFSKAVLKYTVLDMCTIGLLNVLSGCTLEDTLHILCESNK